MKRTRKNERCILRVFKSDRERILMKRGEKKVTTKGDFVFFILGLSLLHAFLPINVANKNNEQQPQAPRRFPEV